MIIITHSFDDAGYIPEDNGTMSNAIDTNDNYYCKIMEIKI